MTEMNGQWTHLPSAWAICASVLILGLGGCVIGGAFAPAGKTPASQAPSEKESKKESRTTSAPTDDPVSLSAEVGDTALPVVPVVPTNPRGHGTKPTIAIVGATQQSRLEPIRRRPAPMLYGLLTGHEPFLGEVDPGRRRGITYKIAKADSLVTDATPVSGEEIKRQAERSRALEAQILEELEKNEKLLEQIGIAEELEAPPAPDPMQRSDRFDTRAAPSTPVERKLPVAIFDKKKIEIESGNAIWNNASNLKLTVYVLDADQDGNPEQIRYYTRTTENLLRVEKDLDFDGQIDTWDRYEEGQLVERNSDTSHNGLPDEWTQYRGATMIERIVDRDGDGVKDAFFTYHQGSLVEERHDSDNDGVIDLVTTYESRTRVATREDRNGDNQFDVWSTYQISEGREVLKSIERDTKADGKPDVFETYDAVGGKAVLILREEDVDGNGTIDIKSVYENGKLVRREISDPSLLPM